MQKLNGITGLRGLIALIIVLYHLQQIRPIVGLANWDWALYQFINMLPVVVAVFFILTGLLRSLGYWGHILHGSKIPDTRRVIIDRWWRIAPAYYVVLISSFAGGIYMSGSSIDSLISFFSGLTFLNWVSPSTFFPASLN
jgi:peptidoglycan/LPS O-acetylase OafA/YrhL